MVKKFADFHVTRRCITVLITARHVTMSLDSWIQSSPSNTSFKINSIAESTHIVSRVAFFLQDFLLKFWVIFAMRATYPAHSSFLLEYTNRLRKDSETYRSECSLNVAISRNLPECILILC
jgi:hypothetical protein